MSGEADEVVQTESESGVAEQASENGKRPAAAAAGAGDGALIEQHPSPSSIRGRSLCLPAWTNAPVAKVDALEVERRELGSAADAEEAASGLASERGERSSVRGSPFQVEARRLVLYLAAIGLSMPGHTFLAISVRMSSMSPCRKALPS